jgi:uncharacterized protein (TIGR03382 family)
MKRFGIGVATFCVATTASAAPGNLLVSSADEGIVYEFSSGDLVPFATGLNLPIGLCVGPNGDIYVAEAGDGQITIITDGGGADYSDGEHFVDVGDLLPVGMLCADDSLIASTYLGLVADTPDGIPGTIVRLGSNLPSGGDLARDPVGNLLIADQGNAAMAIAPGIYDLGMAGALGDMTGVPPLLDSPPELYSIENVDGMMLGGERDAPNVWDFTDLDLDGDEPWAVLPDNGGGIQALLWAGDLGVFALDGDEIYEIGRGGNLGDATPYASGLNTGLYGIQGMLHHVCSANADCDDADACNGAEQCLSNACVAEPPDCDDGDICTADACDPDDGCVSTPIEDCCIGDLDCEIDEVCDAGTHECVPTDPTAGGGDESTGGGDDAGEDDDTAGPTTMTGGPASATTAGDDAGADTDDAGADDDGGSGCGCTTTDETPPTLALLLLGLLSRRRRGSLRAASAAPEALPGDLIHARVECGDRSTTPR